MSGFIGRRGAVSQILREIELSSTNEMRFLAIRGEAGSGKSTLLEHVESLTVDGEFPANFAYGKCSVASRPLTPVREALESLIPPPDTPSTRQRQDVVRRLLRGVKELAPDVAGVLLPGAGLAVAGARFVAEETGMFERLRGRDERLARTEATPPIGSDLDIQVGALLRSLTLETPLVLVIEDAHWIDASSLGVLHRLIQGSHHCAMLLVLTYRSSDVDGGARGERHPLPQFLAEAGRQFGGDLDQMDAGSTIDLDQISRAEGAEFCDQLAAEFDSPDGLAQHLLDVTSGLPLFATEYLRLLEVDGALSFDMQLGTWRYTAPLGPARFPTSVRSVVRERLDRLDDDLLNVLEHCAIEGPTFDAGNIAQLMGMDLLRFIRLASRVLDRRHHILQDAEQGMLPPGRRVYQFQNDVAREELYRSLPGNYRRELHARFADVLQLQQPSHQTLAAVGEHRENAGDLLAAVEAYVEASSLALAARNTLDADLYIQRASRLASGQELPPTTEAALAVYRGRTLGSQGDWKAALAEYQRASELSDGVDDELWCEALLGIGKTSHRVDDNPLSRLALHRLLASPRSAGLQRVRLEATRELAMSQRRAGDLSGALALYDDVRLAALELGDHLSLANLHNNVGIIHGLELGDYHTAIEHYEAAAAMAREHRLGRVETVYLRNLHTYRWIGRSDLALERLNQAVALADEIAPPNDQMRSRAYRARSALSAGKYDAAQADLEEVVTVYAEHLHNDRLVEFEVMTLLSIVGLLDDRPEDATRWAEEAIEFGAEWAGPVQQDIGTPEFVRASVALSRAETDAAELEQVHRQFVESLDSLEAQSTSSHWPMAYNRALAACGAAVSAPDTASARRFREQAIQAFDSAMPLAGAVLLFNRLVETLRGRLHPGILDDVRDHARSRPILNATENYGFNRVEPQHHER